MENKEIEIYLKSLEIGNSMSFESINRKKLIEITDSIPGNFVLNRVSETVYSVLKVDESIRKAAEKVLAEIPKLNWFNRLELKVSPSYTRAIISKFNKENSDSIKVKKHINGSIIYRSVDVTKLDVDGLSELVDELNFLIHTKSTKDAPEPINEPTENEIAAAYMEDENESNEEII